MLELNGYIGFDADDPLKGNLILLTDSLTDGSFLVHHFLSTFLKAGHDVCFLALAQSFSHYNAVAQKLGLNLASLRDSGQLAFINGLEFSLQLMHAGIDSSRAGQPIALQCLVDQAATIQPLYHVIRDASAPKQRDQRNTGSRLLLIDDLSVLISLGLSVQQVMQFVHYCQASQPETTIICLVHHDTDVDDECNAALITQLRHRAHCVLQVQGLDSGYSRDVHGQLKISKRDPTGTTPNRNQPDITLQYKILDKSVTFFAVGTSSAVL
ncbi:elongator complex protein 6-like [Acanthaster planci]|uniref:Elongator complex protein 6 n=1 Tax=Acanthaster planci TaxID=133434 RepID=A0A8B7XTX6_ACAPL|nr:elongator complex protein 6-like [Acanthaster planci]